MRNKILLFGILFFLIGIVSAAYYVTDPNNCPNNYQSQTCSGSDLVCGYSGGITYCYDTSSLNAPGSTASSTTNYACSDTTCNGGYITDCYAYDGSEPHCDNSGNFWCDRSSTCYDVNRLTTCTANVFVQSTCGTCKSGYTYCDGSYTDGDGCEIQSGVTQFNHTSGVLEDNVHHKSDCDHECDSGYLDCDSDIGTGGTGCEVQDGGSCSVGSLSGTYSGCTCVVDKSYFETGTFIEYLVNLVDGAMLWFKNWGTGDLINISNVNNQTFRVDNLTNVITGGNVTAEYYFGDGSQLTGVSSDIVSWDALTDYPTTCSGSQYISALGDTITCSAISITESQVSDLQDYYLESNPFGFYNVTSLVELDPLAYNGTLMYTSNWNATNESYYLKINPFGFYNSTDFDYNDYRLLTNFSFLNSTIYFSGDVGINTATPQNDLNVIGDGNFTGDLYIGDQLTVLGEGTFDQTVTAAYFIGDGSQLTNIVPVPFNQSFNRSVSNVVYLFNLQDIVVLGNNEAATNARLEIYENATDATLVIHEDYGTHSAILNFRRGSEDWQILHNQNLSFQFEEAEKMVITQDGNVGIGTSNPLSKLHIEDLDDTNLDHLALQLENLDVRAGFELETPSATSTGQGIFNIGLNTNRGILNKTGVSDTGAWFRIDTRPSTEGFHWFWEANGTDTETEMMTINATSGNVGINTTSPQNKLNVVGDGNFTGNVTASNFLGTLNWSDLSGYPVACPANTYLTQLGDSVTCTAISDVYLLNTGDTGTGTYTFSGQINLPSTGTTSFVDGGGDIASYALNNINLSGWYGLGMYNPTVGGAYPEQTSGFYDFRNGFWDTKAYPRVDGTAINTLFEAANANIQAHISDNTQAHSDYFLNTGDISTGTIIASISSHGTSGFSGDIAGPNVTSNATNYDIVESLGFTSNYDIASGIADNGYRMGLNIAAYNNDAGFLGTLNEQYGQRIQYGHYTSAGTGTITNAFGIKLDYLTAGAATITNAYSIYSSGAAKMYHAGNVGIGTTSPSSKLSINSGTSEDALRVQSTDANVRMELVDDTASGYLFQQAGKVGLGFKAYLTHAGKGIIIDTDGFVGILTESPTTALEVTGNITLSNANNCIIFNSGGKICSGV